MSGGDFPPSEGGTEHCDTNYRPRYLHPPGYRGCRYPASKCERKCKCMRKCKCKSKCKCNRNYKYNHKSQSQQVQGQLQTQVQTSKSNGYAHSKVPVSALIRVVLGPGPLGSVRICG